MRNLFCFFCCCLCRSFCFCFWSCCLLWCSLFEIDSRFCSRWHNIICRYLQHWYFRLHRSYWLWWSRRMRWSILSFVMSFLSISSWFSVFYLLDDKFFDCLDSVRIDLICQESINCRDSIIEWVIWPDNLRQDIGESRQFENSSHWWSCFQTSTCSSRTKHYHTWLIFLCDHIRYRSWFSHRDSSDILICIMRSFGYCYRNIITLPDTETDMSCSISYQYCRSKSHSSSASSNLRYFPDFQERLFKSLQFFFSHRGRKQKYKIRYAIIILLHLHREILLFRDRENHSYQTHNDQSFVQVTFLQGVCQRQKPSLT